MKLYKNSTICSGVLIVALVFSMGVLAGCGGHKRDRSDDSAMRASKTERRVSEKRSSDSDGMSRVSAHFPQGIKAILVERSAPANVRGGQPFDQYIKITNVSDVTVRDIDLTHYLAENFTIERASPTAKSVGDGRAKWFFDELGPGESELITITGAAKAAGPVAGCAAVTYNIPVCLTIDAIEPRLKLTKTGPAEVLLCNPIKFILEVSNPGIGKAENVKIIDTLPKGLLTKDGQSTVAFDVGTLNSGESRELSFDVKAQNRGSFVNIAKASADQGLAAQATHEVVVRQPSLEVTKTGPSNRFIGRTATYQITVANRGDGTAENTILVDTVPRGTTVLKASNGGRISGSKVTWDLGNLAAGDSKKVSLNLKMPEQMSTVRNVAEATAVCSREASADFTTQVAGIAAVLLEVIDIDDPVEIGAQAGYQIVVTNQGSANATNVAIVCEIPPEMAYVSSDGATRARVDGNRIAFGALPSLEPQAKTTYRVVTKALRSGDVRFKVALTSDQLTSPVNETESTNIYE